MGLFWHSKRPISSKLNSPAHGTFVFLKKGQIRSKNAKNDRYIVNKVIYLTGWKIAHLKIKKVRNCQGSFWRPLKATRVKIVNFMGPPGHKLSESGPNWQIFFFFFANGIFWGKLYQHPPGSSLGVGRNNLPFREWQDMTHLRYFMALGPKSKKRTQGGP